MPDIGEKIDPARHMAQPWRVHTLAPDFKLLDVWALPIVADPSKGETFDKFLKLVLQNGLQSSSQIARFFVWLRAELGDIFHWEYAPSQATVAGTNEHSITERLTEEDQRANKTGDKNTNVANSITKLSMVYERENEALFEIHNKTVSALFHLSFVPTEDGKKTPELAVYTKMRGFKSKLYMGIIEPFRLVAVYPQWISTITKKWEDLKQTDASMSTKA